MTPSFKNDPGDGKQVQSYEDALFLTAEERQARYEVVELRIRYLAEAKMRKDPTLSLGEALVKTQLENPNLLREYFILSNIIAKGEKTMMNLSEFDRLVQIAMKERKLSRGKAISVVAKESPEVHANWLKGQAEAQKEARDIAQSPPRSKPKVENFPAPSIFEEKSEFDRLVVLTMKEKNLSRGKAISVVAKENLEVHANWLKDQMKAASAIK